MKKIFKKILIKIINININFTTSILRRFIHIYPSTLIPYLYSKKFKIKINTIYDIGANEGLWTSSRKIFYPSSLFYLFEANPKHEEDLKKYGEFYIGALSDCEKEVLFYFRDGGDGTGDSYYKENTEIYENITPVATRTEILSKVVSDLNFQKPDYIKLDTQGSELDILRGFGDLISSVAMISMEVNLYDYNQSSPTFDEVIAFMKDRGFYAQSIIEQHTNRTKFKKGILNQVDILFINKIFLNDK